MAVRLVASTHILMNSHEELASFPAMYYCKLTGRYAIIAENFCYVIIVCEKVCKVLEETGIT